MYRYDPLVAPDPQEWLAIAEDERVASVERYHRRQRIRMPNIRVHALFQTIAETQIAMGDEIPAAAKLRELMEEGRTAMKRCTPSPAWWRRNIISS